MAESSEFNPANSGISTGSDGKKLKEDISDLASRGGDAVLEDPSRNALHQGSEFDANVADIDDKPRFFRSSSLAEPNANTGSGSADALPAGPMTPDGAPGDSPDLAQGSGPFPTAGGGMNADAAPVPGDPVNPGPQPAPTGPDSEMQTGDNSGQNTDLSQTIARMLAQNANPSQAQPAPTGPASSDAAATNSAPDAITFAAALDVDENAAGAVIGQLSTSDRDAGDSHSYTVSDDRFEIVDGALKLKEGMALDHESEATVALDITTTDSQGLALTQSFDISVADVNEGPSAVALGSTSIAENSDGAIVGQLRTIDPDANDIHSYTISDERFEIADGTVKLKPGMTLDHDLEPTVSVSVTATDNGGLSLTQTFDISVIEVPEIDTSSGFSAEYFDMNQQIRNLDEVDWSTAPTFSEVTQNINYENGSRSFWDGGSKDTFGAKITGNIDVAEGGSFTFYLGGDDGTMLFIDGNPVVDNDGLHGYRTQSETVDLEPGPHVIEVRYFENYGNAGLKLEWQGPGIDGRALVTAPDIGDLQTISGMPMTVEINTRLPGDNFANDVQQSLGGLPEGTVIQAGENVARVDAGGSVDITDWDTSLLQITPPADFVGTSSANLVTTTTPASGDAVQTMVTLEFSVMPLDVPEPSADMQTGFHASYYDVDHSIRALDQIDWDSDATHEEVVSDIDYANSRASFWEDGSQDTFGVKLTGRIDVKEGGRFDFFLGGDDGAVLFVNGAPVIDNDGLHGFRTRTGTVELEPGPHEIEVRYFENYGNAGLKLEWDGPGTEGRELVSPSQDLVVSDNGLIAVEISIDTGGESTGLQMAGLPADTILMSADNVAVADGSNAVDLTGWDMNFLEIAPPPWFQGVIDGEITSTSTAFNGQELQGTSAFSITVGDVAQANAATQPDALDQLSQLDGGGAQPAGWTDDGTAQTAGDDDVLGEEIAVAHDADQATEIFDTYERQDW